MAIVENVGADPAVANTIGVGFLINADNTVGIVVMLGDQVSEHEHVSLASIAIDAETASFVVAKIQALLVDVKIAEEAISTMGIEAATEYLHNWAKRDSSGLN